MPPPFIPKPPPDRVFLEATSARAARKEIQARWPHYEVDFTGYDEDGNDVLLSSVRRLGDPAYVATARRNRSNKPVRFVATRFK